MSGARLGASFRDPSGFVFRHEGVLYRQVNLAYAPHYDLLMSSGLFRALVDKRWLVDHREVDPGAIAAPAEAGSQRYKLLEPEAVPYVSYPYEWCFSELKDAALLTLAIQECALERGMTLKDASAYNVQFVGARPVFIDTLSFERFEDGTPWVAYRQFCQHFLGPLAAMARRDVRLRHLLKSYIDGLPLDLVSALLPRRTLASYGLLAHVHLHSASQKRHQDDARGGAAGRAPRMTKRMQLALVASLRSAVEKCRLAEMKTEWGSYYEDTNYSAEGMAEKERQVAALLDAHCGRGGKVHDLGANTGRFSRLAAAGRYVLSHDIDEMAVERNYLSAKADGLDNVLPLVLDLTNPTPGLGWALAERDSLLDRIDGDFVLALALIHHIVISNNVPMAEAAAFFRRLAGGLIIEFVPKEDSQVRRLLATRRDIFPDYDAAHFEEAFGRHFDVLDRQRIAGTERTLYALRRK